MEPPRDHPEPASPAALLRVILTDVVRGVGLEGTRLASLAALAARPAALAFRRTILDADAIAGSHGLAAAADLLLARFSGPVTSTGTERLPATGPLLVVANHPGTVDTPALWRALEGRRDLRIVALDRPFAHQVPHVRASLLLLDKEAHSGRFVLLRTAAAHLREGGALLTFPAGEIEPDPAVRRTDARRSLAGWSRSPELLARLVPGLTVVPVSVAGVLSRRALDGPVPRLRRTVDDRELTAATLQILLRDRSIRPSVRVGVPLTGSDDLTARLACSMDDLLACAGHGTAPTKRRGT